MPRRQPRSVLIADDDRGIRGLLEVILRSDDCSVIAAKDGVEALRLANLHHVDLMLVDLNMPRLDGIAVCQQYRERGGVAPVVLLSASGDIENAARYCAADDFIAKPFKVSTILEMVARYAGARELPPRNRPAGEDGPTSIRVECSWARPAVSRKRERS